MLTSPRLLQWVVLLICSASHVAYAQGSQYAAPEYLASDEPPYTYMHDGAVQGYTVELLAAIWGQSKIESKPILLKSWQEAYYQLGQRPNVILLNTAKTKVREHLFKWVCGIDTISFALIQLRKNAVILTPETDYNKFQFSASHSGAGEQLLFQQGVGADNIRRAPNYKTLMKFLASERVQFAVGASRLLLWSWMGLGLSPKDIMVSEVLARVPLCFAFNKEASPELINKFEDAMVQLNRSGTVKRLKQKYFLD